MRKLKEPIKLSKNATLVKRNNSAVMLELKGKCVVKHDTEDRFLVGLSLGTLERLVKALKRT